MKLITLLLLIMLWLPQVSFAVELTPEQQQAKQQGIALFMQGHEAKADDDVAQYNRCYCAALLMKTIQ